MWPASKMIVACADYLHILGFVALIPSHDLQPFAKNDLIDMEILQCSERVQLHPICVVPLPITIEVCVDCRGHCEARCHRAERFKLSDGGRDTPRLQLRRFTAGCCSALLTVQPIWDLVAMSSRGNRPNVRQKSARNMSW
jgi:hypothetical protein